MSKDKLVLIDMFALRTAARDAFRAMREQPTCVALEDDQQPILMAYCLGVAMAAMRVEMESFAALKDMAQAGWDDFDHAKRAADERNNS